MVLRAGEVVHVIEHHQRQVNHFAGSVEACEGGVVRVHGYLFVPNMPHQEFARKDGRRVRLFSLHDPGLTLSVLPDGTNVDKLCYQHDHNKLVLTDGQGFRLEVFEFASRGRRRSESADKS